jgi:hypothetical protein
MDLQTIARGRTSHPISSVQNDADLVSSIQIALKQMGFSAATPDGRWNSGTAAAYKSFAQRYGFNAGEISPRAANFILKSVDVPAKPAPPSPSPSPISTAPSKPSTPSPGQGNFFEEALRFTLPWEGGYVNHPNDPGGATNKGVIQSTYDSYRRRKGQPLRSVIQITDPEVREIYRDDYWEEARCDLMIRPLAIVHFDTAVNFGVGGAVEFLQETLELRIDGSFGPITLSALERANTAATAKRYAKGRIDYRYLRVRQDPSQDVFLRGWLNRDNDLVNYVERIS